MEKLTVKMNDWLKNAGILGLYRILIEAGNGDEIVVEENSISFSGELLENFSEKYFNYFINNYKKTLSLFSLIDYASEIKMMKNKGIENFSKEDLEKLNAKIKDFKEKLAKKSYRSAFELAGGDFDPAVREKELTEIKLKGKEELSDRFEDIEKQIELLKDTISVLKEEKSKKYIGAYNVMYSVLNQAIGQISFLYPQVKEKDMYKELHSYFIQAVFDYLKADKQKYKYRCFSCDEPIDTSEMAFSMMNHIGFDKQRKTSNVWNFYNDAFICPVCHLTYACVPAGFTYFRGKGLFVNYNHSIRGMQIINDSVRNGIYADDNAQHTVFGGLIQGIQEEFYENIKYQLQDLQVVRFSDDRYTFNILSKGFLNIIKNNKDSFKRTRMLRGKGINVYEEVIDALLNGRNLFLLIYRLIRDRLSREQELDVRMNDVYSVVLINQSFLKEVGAVEKKKNFDSLKVARMMGRSLQEEYGGFDADGKHSKKLNGIAYRMLNSLKTNNKLAFMDSLINAYMYVEKPIPNLFSDYLNNDLVFKNLGYAFVTGMLGEKWGEVSTDTDNVAK